MHSADEHLRAARHHHDLGELSQALSELRQAHSLVDGDTALLFDVDSLMGSVLLELGQLQEAGAALERALGTFQKLERPPDDELASVHNNLGIVLRRLGHLDEALSSFARARRIWSMQQNHDRLMTLYSNLGNTLVDLNRLDEAVSTFRRAVALGRGDSDTLAGLATNLGIALRKQGDVEGAIEACTQATDMWKRLIEEGHPRLEARLALGENNLGNAFFDAGRLQEAAEAYRRSRDLCRGEPHSLAIAEDNLGATLCQMGRYEQALSCHRRALALYQELGQAYLDQEQAKVWRGLANALYELNRLEEARDAYRQARRLLPSESRELAEVESDIGLTSMALGQPEQAIPAYRRALALWMSLKDTNEVIAIGGELACALASGGQVQQALACIAKARPLATTDELQVTLAFAEDNLGEAFYHSGQLPESLDAHRRAEALLRPLGDSRLGRTLHNLGLVHHRMGQHELALETLQEARRHVEDQPVELALLLSATGQVHMDLDQSEEAARAYRQARDAWLEVGDEPGRAEAENCLGIALLAVGNAGEAAAAFRKALELWTALDEPERRAATLADLAAAYFSRGDLNEAVDRYRQAADLYQAIGRQELELARAHYDLGLVLHRRGDLEEALESMTTSRELLQELGEELPLARLEISLGMLLTALDRPTQAVRAYERGRDLLERLGQPGLARAETLLGHGLRDLGQNQEAIAAYQRARNLLDQDDERLAEVLNAMADALSEQGHPIEAVERHLEAFRLLCDLAPTPDTLFGMCDSLVGAALAARDLDEPPALHPLLLNLVLSVRLHGDRSDPELAEALEEAIRTVTDHPAAPDLAARMEQLFKDLAGGRDA